MGKYLLAMASAVLLSLSVSACPGPGGSNIDAGPNDCVCAQGEGCGFDGKCAALCTTTDDCGLCGICGASGVCAPAPCTCNADTDCDDGDPCNGAESCQASTCVPAATPFQCPASTNACFDNICVASNGVATCELEAKAECPCSTSEECDDGAPCNGVETCAAGVCTAGTVFACPPVSALCRINTCLADAQGLPSCVESLDADGASCVSTQVCTGPGTCDALGACNAEPLPDVCPCQTDAECDDSNPCNGPESCAGGSCQPGLPFNCAAPSGECVVNECFNANGVPSCVESQAAVGYPCTADGACEDEAGTCAAGGICTGPPKACDDGVACTVDSCDSATGECVHSLDPTLCDDGLACTVDTCASTGCVATPDNSMCNDGFACTDEVCDVLSGCIGIPNHAACDDVLSCTVNTCDPTAADSDAQGCVFPASDALCADAFSCTLNEQCDPGAVQADPVSGCTWDSDTSVCADDGNVCTNDACQPSNAEADPVTGCGTVNNEVQCLDQDECSTNSQCFGGTCQGIHQPDFSPCGGGFCVAGGCKSATVVAVDGPELDTLGLTAGPLLRAVVKPSTKNNGVNLVITFYRGPSPCSGGQNTPSLSVGRYTSGTSFTLLDWVGFEPFKAGTLLDGGGSGATRLYTADRVIQGSFNGSVTCDTARRHYDFSRSFQTETEVGASVTLATVQAGQSHVGNSSFLLGGMANGSPSVEIVHPDSAESRTQIAMAGTEVQAVVETKDSSGEVDNIIAFVTNGGNLKYYDWTGNPCSTLNSPCINSVARNAPLFDVKATVVRPAESVPVSSTAEVFVFGSGHALRCTGPPMVSCQDIYGSIFVGSGGFPATFAPAAATVTSDGSVVVAGKRSSIGGSGNYIYVLPANANGPNAWLQSPIGGPLDVTIVGMIQNLNGTIYIAGQTPAGQVYVWRL